MYAEAYSELQQQRYTIYHARGGEGQFGMASNSMASITISVMYGILMLPPKLTTPYIKLNQEKRAKHRYIYS